MVASESPLGETNYPTCNCADSVTMVTDSPQLSFFASKLTAQETKVATKRLISIYDVKACKATLVNRTQSEIHCTGASNEQSILNTFPSTTVHLQTKIHENCPVRWYQQLNCVWSLALGLEILLSFSRGADVPPHQFVCQTTPTNHLTKTVL